MKCLVCGRTVAEGESKCGFCGFPVILITGEDEGTKKALEEKALEWRKKLLSGISIGTQIFGYEVKNEEYQLKETKTLNLANLPDLKVGVPSWCGELFGFLEEDRTLDLQIVIVNNGNFSNRNISIPLPGVFTEMQVGVLLNEDLSITILGGRPDYYGYSEPIGVLG
ncbi:MAG: hypothetical protein Q4B15_04045 [Lachnospiraceae bacterium]|nr:hypothetical protein [Lachnospiraceae bacterium]